MVCGPAGMPTCPVSTGAPADCPPPPAGASYVDVYTSTKTASGSTLLPPVFGRALLGKKKGEKVVVKVPAGDFTYKVVSIS